MAESNNIYDAERMAEVRARAGAKPRTCGDCAGMPDADFTDRNAINRRCQFCQRLFRQTDYDGVYLREA